MTKPVHTIAPLLVDEPDVSKAWARAVLHAVDNEGSEISPLILSVTGFDEHGAIPETPAIRTALDSLLTTKRTPTKPMRSVEDVAFTIFPQRLWQIAQGDRAALFRYYRDAFPRYQAMNPRDNRRGLYFERLTAYGRGPCDGNQLEWILSQYERRAGVRRSMFQASVFDPERDHVPDAQLQFPCLQHVSFEPTKQGLAINSFYATQQLFAKAYGNYLGLAQLGAFMANQMGTKLLRLNVFVGVAKFERISKTDADLQPLIAICRSSCNLHDQANMNQATPKATAGNIA